MTFATGGTSWGDDRVGDSAEKVRLPEEEARAIRRACATEYERSPSTGSDAGHPPIPCGPYRSTGRIFQEVRENRIEVPSPSELLGVTA